MLWVTSECKGRFFCVSDLLTSVRACMCVYVCVCACVCMCVCVCGGVLVCAVVRECGWIAVLHGRH